MIFMLAFGTCHAADNWIKDALSAESMSPPFKKTFYAGELLQIKLQDATAFRLMVSDDSNGGMVAVIPMRGRKRAGKKLKLENETMLFTQSTDEADGLAVKVLTGKVNLEGDVEKMHEIVIEEGQEGEIPINPNRESITGRFINISDFRSTVTFRFMLDGQDVSNTSDRQRTLSLEFKGSSRAKTWKGGADKVIVKVHHGRVKFKAGHPFYAD
jgi:hypothetical protein